MDDISLALNPPRFVKSRKKSPIRLTRSTSAVWPLAAINGRAPAILESPDRGARGVDLAYPRLGAADAIAACPPGTPNGTETHVMPPMTCVLAIDDGVITFAGRLGHGLGIILDHGGGSASHYAHLEALCAIRTDLYCPRAQPVRAGDVIGYVGAPAPGAFKRLHFELWRRDDREQFVAIDPYPKLAACRLVQHHDQFTPVPPTAQAQKEAA